MFRRKQYLKKSRYYLQKLNTKNGNREYKINNDNDNECKRNETIKIRLSVSLVQYAY